MNTLTNQSKSTAPADECFDPRWADIQEPKFTGNQMPVFSESERRKWLDERARRGTP